MGALVFALPAMTRWSGLSAAPWSLSLLFSSAFHRTKQPFQDRSCNKSDPISAQSHPKRTPPLGLFPANPQRLMVFGWLKPCWAREIPNVKHTDWSIEMGHNGTTGWCDRTQRFQTQHIEIQQLEKAAEPVLSQCFLGMWCSTGLQPLFEARSACCRWCIQAEKCIGKNQMSEGHQVALYQSFYIFLIFIDKWLYFTSRPCRPSGIQSGLAYLLIFW